MIVELSLSLKKDLNFLSLCKGSLVSCKFVTSKMTVRTPGTPSSKIDRTPVSTPNGQRAREEKIVVTVRLRPLSKREQLAKDQVAWECVDDTTIVHKPPSQDRSPQASSFTFGT